MLSAPCKISVSERRPAVKPKPATQIDAARRRCEARIAVVCDARLSPGARLLYVLLDEVVIVSPSPPSPSPIWPAPPPGRAGCAARG